MRYLLLFILVLLLTPSYPSRAQFAGFGSDTSRQIVNDSISLFWNSGSKVIDSGELVSITPPKRRDLNKPIIKNEDALRIVTDSYIVGNAIWCEIEWNSYFLEYMQEQRKKQYTQIQIAYIGFLFGAGQTELSRSLKASGQLCPPNIKENIERLLTSSKTSAVGSDAQKDARPF